MKTKRNFRLWLNALAFALMISSAAFSQSEMAWLNNMSAEDSAAINALVLYPDSIRLSIFEACKYPEVIVRMAVLQRTTSSQFTNLVSSYSKKEQENFWNLTRYPGLIDALVTARSESKNQISTILNDYPAEIHDVALEYAQNYSGVLHNINDLDKKSEQDFKNIIADYPAAAKDAFNDLVDLPEVLSILNDHMQMTVLVGDMYKRNPQRLIQIADSLNLVLAKKNAEDLAAWKNAIESDSSARNDLKNAALDYAQQNCDYDQTTCTQPMTTAYVSDYVCYPYPYWFGYPYWYPYYYWYPYPYWFDWGFYLDPFGGFVWIGLPSYYFTYWYYYYPYNYYHYPYLCNTYVNYYYGPRGSVSSNTNVVRNWVAENKNYLPSGFMTASTDNRINAIKQVGQFEADYQTMKDATPKKAITRDEYLYKNQKEYPALTAPSKQEASNKSLQQQNVPEVKEPPVRQPHVNIFSSPNQPAQKQKPVPPKYDFEKVNPAQQYHKNTWDNASPKQTQPRQSAPQHQAPSPIAPAPKQPSPKSKPR